MEEAARRRNCRRVKADRELDGEMKLEALSEQDGVHLYQTVREMDGQSKSCKPGIVGEVRTDTEPGGKVKLEPMPELDGVKSHQTRGRRTAKV